MVDKAVSEAAAAMARAKWAKKTKAERHQIAVELNEYRWKHKRTSAVDSTGGQSQLSTKSGRSKRAK